ncbi:MAG: hypothetical protein ABFD52_04960 [Acidobacteriota bacterium]
MAEVYYEIIEAARVDPGKITAADCALRRARDDLGLPEIEIRWVRPVSESQAKVLEGLAGVRRLLGEIACHIAGTSQALPKDGPISVDREGGFWAATHPVGSALGNGRGWRKPKIFMNADQPAQEISASIFHEAKHLSDYRSGLFDFGSPEGAREAETSANLYAARMTRSVERNQKNDG